MINLDGVKISIKQVLNSQFGNIFRSKTTTFMFGAFIFLTSLIAGWIPDGLTALIFDHQYTQAFWMLSVSIGSLVFLLVGAYHYRQNLNWFFKSYKPKQKRILMLFLSTPGFVKKETIEQTKAEIRDYIRKNLKKENLEDFISELDKSKYRSWAMPLRAINYHLSNNGPLEKVVVFTSEASDPFFAEFKEILPEAVRNRLELIKKRIDSPEENAFEDISAVADSIDQAYKDLKKKGYSNKDIIVDITGGQKVNSIAAAFMTLLEDREFQYISTNDKKVRSYKVELVKIE